LWSAERQWLFSFRKERAEVKGVVWEVLAWDSV
jgi:hypothetical protein